MLSVIDFSQHMTGNVYELHHYNIITGNVFFSDCEHFPVTSELRLCYSVAIVVLIPYWKGVAYRYQAADIAK